jgi:tetratricopeptide (TPR) repeat protein
MTIRLTHFFSLFLCCLMPLVAVANDRDLFNRALGLSKQGQWQQAADIYLQLASKNPQWPEPKNNLAVSYLNLGKITEAQKALDAAVVSRNSFSVAQNNRQRLYDYLAAQAYSKALSQTTITPLPALELISALELPPQTVTATPVAVAPPVTAAVNKTDVTTINAALETAVNNWAHAWSAANVKNYLAAYSARFKPDDGKSFAEWENTRRVRLQITDNPRVEVQNLRIYVDTAQQQAVVEFLQSYTSSTYSDRTLKQLLLTLEGNTWRILAERVITQM